METLVNFAVPSAFEELYSTGTVSAGVACAGTTVVAAASAKLPRNTFLSGVDAKSEYAFARLCSVESRPKTSSSS